MTVRELRAVRQSAAIETDGAVLYVKHLPRRVKKIAKQVIVGRAHPRRVPIMGRYLRAQQHRDQSHHFHLPKARWGPGPWQDEPDERRFTHAGLRCAVVRNTWVTGSLNGYVAVPPTHPWWGKHYHECTTVPQCEPEPPVDYDTMPEGFPAPSKRMREQMREMLRWDCKHTPVTVLTAHGGITFSGPTPFGQPDDWWFAFDCAHAGDLAPMMQATLKQMYPEKEWREREAIFAMFPDVYRDLAYVRQETEQLAEQLSLIGQV